MTSPLTKVRGFKNTGLIRNETGYNGKLYFTAHSSEDEREIIFNGDEKQASAVWVTDGSEDGTRSLYDFAPGKSQFVPTQQFNTANNRLFFQIRIDGADEPSGGRTELWSYLDINPATNSEKLIKIADSLPNTYRDAQFDDKTEAINSGLFYFQSPEEGEDELWFTNGGAGASNTYSLGRRTRSEFVWLEGADNLLYFVADGEERVDGSDEPRWDPNELWVTSSTPGTLQKISDFDYQPLWNVSSPIFNVAAIGDSLYFCNHDTENYDFNAPWTSDGTLESTKPFSGLTYQAGNDWNVPAFNADHFTLFNGEIYFLSYQGTERPYSENLYAYNPASDETRFVAQTSDEWANFSSTRELFVFNDLIYFSGHTDDTGWELWSTDGTTSGTGLVKDLSYSETNGEIISGAYNTFPQQFTIHKKNRSTQTSQDDELYFKDDSDQLWKIEAGSSIPTQVELPNIYSGVNAITSVDLANGGSDLYFTMGQSIYKLDNQSTIESNPDKDKDLATGSTPTPDKYEPLATQNNIKGKKRNDVLRGTKKSDFIDGKDGNDKLYGSKGNDVLKGGKGDDILIGSKGEDYLDGSKGTDSLNGGKGADVFQISKGIDLVEDFDITQGDRIALDKRGKYTIIDGSDGVLIKASRRKQLLLNEVDYNDIIAAGVDLFVQRV